MRIVLEHVDYTYQPGTVSEAAALRDINFSVEQGELLAVIGHGGSGKSTLALLLAGLYEPTGGSLRICEETKHDPALFGQVGLVFQYPEQQLFGESVFEEVAFAARNFGTPNDYLPTKVRQALDAVGLDADAFWHRSPFLLSGGQKRRVCIASVLVFNPRVIILDEPTAGLDEGGRRWLAGLMCGLRQKGRTVIWVTHDMAEAAELAERIVVLDQGRIVLDGSPAEVFAAEDILKHAHLRVPPAAALVRGLKARGLPLSGEAVTVRGAYEEIRAWLRGEADAAARHAQEQADLEALAEKARAVLPALPPESGEDEDEEAWERQAVAELRAIAKADPEALDAEPPAAPPAAPLPEPEAEQPAVDFDLTGLTGEESPRVPEWQGGADDV